MLYTAQATPDALALSLPDLRSRLANAPASRCRRWTTTAAAKCCANARSGAGWCWTRPRWTGCCGASDRDLASLTALLDRLDRASLAAQRRITVPFLRQTLGS